MTLKKIKFIDVFLIFILSFLAHFMYSWFPSTLFSIFFPVNESIWEHMKILFTSILIVSLFDYWAFKKWNIKSSNFLASAFISAFTSIPIFLIIYLPLYNTLGENMILNITLLFFVICLAEIINYNILKTKHLKNLGYLSFIFIIITYIIFALLTYYPPENDLFYDTKEQKYGINHYVI